MLKIQCGDCEYYKMIDSGYGNCYRYPPKIVATEVGWLSWKMRMEYPEVAWCEKACGEYTRRWRG